MDGGMGGALHKTDSDGNLKVFNVEHDENDQWLHSNYDNPENFWDSNNRCVFARRKSLHLSPINLFFWESFVFEAVRSSH